MKSKLREAGFICWASAGKNKTEPETDLSSALALLEYNICENSSIAIVLICLVCFTIICLIRWKETETLCWLY